MGYLALHNHVRDVFGRQGGALMGSQVPDLTLHILLTPGPITFSLTSKLSGACSSPMNNLS